MSDKPIASGGKLIIPWKLGGSAQGQDNYLVYNFMKRLLVPYTQWEAFSKGVIDANGNVLIKKNRRTSAQNRAFGQFDLLMIKLRELLKTAPTAKNKLLPATAALYLLREYQSGSQSEEIDTAKLDQIYEELVATNNVGDGQIAGTVGDPPVKKNKKFKILRRRSPNG
jgi:hypothetical protein